MFDKKYNKKFIKLIIFGLFFCLQGTSCQETRDPRSYSVNDKDLIVAYDLPQTISESAFFGSYAPKALESLNSDTITVKIFVGVVYKEKILKDFEKLIEEGRINVSYQVLNRKNILVKYSISQGQYQFVFKNLLDNINISTDLSQQEFQDLFKIYYRSEILIKIKNCDAKIKTQQKNIFEIEFGGNVYCSHEYHEDTQRIITDISTYFDVDVHITAIPE